MSFKQSPPVSVPELWAGVECTVNRVGDAYFRQLDRNGHLDRADDVERFGVDPDAVAADRIRDESGCVRRYERSFLRPVLEGDPEA